MGEGCAVMGAEGANGARRKGFTYTISMLLLVLLLISIASYMQEWRKSQQASLTAFLPTDSIRLQERVAAGAAEVLGADARAERSSPNQTTVKLWTRFPFRKEGADVAPLSEYASSLPYAMRGAGAEVVLSANSLSGPNATVMSVAGSGVLNHSNDGLEDVSEYAHPLGWREVAITLSIYCNKSAERIVPLAAAGTPSSGGGVTYFVNYSDSGKVNYTANASTYSYNNASFSVLYADGTRLSFTSNFSGTLARNITKLAYTKSPGAALVLPFDSNASVGVRTVRDYSQYAAHMSPGGGASANAPSWGASDCWSGGCYAFDGINDFLNGSAQNFTDWPVAAAQGAERVLNGGFESPGGTVPDNGASDVFNNWTNVNGGGTCIFDATRSAMAGSRAIKLYNSTSTSDYVYQNISILENTPYTLSFYANGSGSRYAVVINSNNSYLQDDGSWSASPSFLGTGASDSGYIFVACQFSLPLGSTNISIRLYPSSVAGTSAYYDEVSLRQSAGMNGGFEYYFNNNIG